LESIQLNKDADLLQRIKDGDEVAFELLFYKYKGKLYDFVKHSLSVNEDSESIVQEIFVRLWINRSQLDPTKSLNAYLYTMARNEVFGHLRKLLVRRKYLEELNFSLKESSETSDWQIEYEELKSMVARLIGMMPEKRREIFVLSRSEGLSYKEIAGQLGISENTVDSQIRKALAFLKENLRNRLQIILFFVPFLKIRRK
jgi:RNA polymerase sigma-70 factor, ECF subfamily